MHIVKKAMGEILIAALILILLAGCAVSSDKQAFLSMENITFRDIPGITDEEIKAIEELQQQGSSFIYGVSSSTEAFVREDGGIGGFSTLFGEWLSGLFNIPFRIELYEWNELIEKLNSGDVDFTGEITPTDERQKIYYMSDPIAERMVSIMRIKDSENLANIALTRPLRFAFFESTVTVAQVSAFFEDSSHEIIFVNDFETAYRMLKAGEVDAFISENAVEAAFDIYGGVVVESFLPLVFSPVSLAAKKPALAPVISVVTKAIRYGALPHLAHLYTLGYNEYLAHKFYSHLNAEERQYIKNHNVVKMGAQSYNYPIDFYNAYEQEWQGIIFDVLKEVSVLTGLLFEVSTGIHTGWSDLLEILEHGDVSFVPQLSRTPDRENRYLWPETVMMKEHYLLISRSDFPKLKVNDILSIRVGLVKDYAHTAMFHLWFPDHANVKEYEDFESTLAALENGDVDVMMGSMIQLLSLINYEERPGYKANLVFDYTYDIIPGFNKDEAVLLSVMDKAFSMIDINGIYDHWMRKTYDYRAKLLQAQRPWLIGAIALSLIILTLITVFFIRSRKIGRRLEKLVKQRTSELQQRSSELELQTSTLRTMVDSIPDIIFCMDADLKFTLCNQFLLNYFGITKDNVLADKSLERTVMAGETADNAININRKVINERQKIAYEEWLQAADGTKRLFETIKAPLIIDGDAAGVVGIAHDITEHKTMEEEALLASRSKSAFLANMSHEMRTPMNVIVGLTNLMLEDDDPAVNLKENLKKINVAGNTLLGLINDVLDISKIEAGKLELTPVEYEVPSLLNDIITLNFIRIEEKPIVFKLDINENLPYKLFGDDLRVKQIINNLLSNAFKYTRKGTITLGLAAEINKQRDVWLSVYVSDTGIGIREEDLKKLFTDYNQVDVQTNRLIEGTGLGLSISKKLTEMMDGKITAESKYGHGTTFRLLIRQGYISDKTIGKEVTEKLCGFRYTEDKSNAGKKLVRPDLSYAKVLVVDDMQTNLDVASGLLRKYKMGVDCVTSGKEAIDRIAEGTPVYNAIFMDHMMPGMDGMEATEKIRAIGTDYAMAIPIIALTANAIAGNEQMFLSRNFQGFLAKPINIMHLDSIVKKWIQNKTKE